jgi:hypothetical protein
MPVIGTSGALSYDKVPLGAGSADTYWMLTAPNCKYYTSTFKNNELWLAGQAGVNNDVELSYAAVFKVADDFTPIIARQTGLGTSGGLTALHKIVVNNSNDLTTVGQGYITANNNGGIITTFDSSASVLTSKFYQGPILIDPVATYQPRVNYDVVYDSAGNYYVAGWTRETVAAGYGVFLTKFNGSTNAIIWSKYAYDTARKVTTDPNITGGTTPILIKTDSSNNVILIYQAIGNVGQPLRILSFNSAGALNYQTQYSSAVNGYYGFTMDSSNNIYLIISVFIGSSYRFILVKYNSSLVQQWSTGLPDTFYKVNAFRQDIPIKIFNDKLYISLDRQTGGTPLGSYLMCVDLSGNFVWATKLNYVVSSVEKLTQWQSLAISNRGIYAVFNPNVTGSLRYTYNIIKLPLDGTVPGTGNYTVSANTYMTYSSESSPFTTGFTPTRVSGTLTVADASALALTNTTLSTGNSISAFTTISL